MGFADDHGSGYHPQYIQGKSDHDGDRGYWWIFALVIIFLAIIFLVAWRRDDGRRDGLDANALAIPAMTAAVTAGQHRDDGNYEHWDGLRDNLREFATVRESIKDTAYTQAREQDRYFYEQRAALDRNNHDTLLGFKNSEILGLQNTAGIAKEIAALRDQLKDEKIAALFSEVNHLKTVAMLAPKPPMPAYIPHYNGLSYPPQHVYVAEQPCC